MSTRPTFLYANEILKDNITVDYGSGYTKFLVDRNEEIAFVASGGAKTLKLSCTIPSKSINRIFIQNTNMSDFTITYNSGTNFSTAISVAGSSLTNFYFEFNAVTATNIELICTNVSGSKANVEIGQLYVGKELFEIPATVGCQISDWKKPAVKQTIISLSDGTIQKVYVRKLRQVYMELVLVSDSDKTNLYTAFEENKRNALCFIFYPDTSSWDGMAGHYNWVNAFDFDNYTSGFDADGWKGNIELQQACGTR